VPGAIGKLPLVTVVAIASILFLLGFFEREVYWGAALALFIAALAFAARQ
jgi:hypothetical protein